MVTTIDPCMMCIGAILEVGFKLVVLATNNIAGLNFLNKPNLTFLNDAMTKQVKTNFSYPAVNASNSFSRAASFAPVPKLFKSTEINNTTYALIENLFEATTPVVRNALHSAITPNNLVDLTTLPTDHLARTLLKAKFPESLSYRNQTNDEVDEQLAPILKAAAKQDIENGGIGDAVALLDHFGNLICCLPGDQNRSPIKTALMRVIREYSKFRYDVLMAEGELALKHFSRLKYCKIISLYGLNISPKSLMEIGAYGSAIEALQPSYPLK